MFVPHATWVAAMTLSRLWIAMRITSRIREFRRRPFAAQAVSTKATVARSAGIIKDPCAVMLLSLQPAPFQF